MELNAWWFFGALGAVFVLFAWLFPDRWQRRFDRSWRWKQACRRFCGARTDQACTKSINRPEDCPHPESLEDAEHKLEQVYNHTLKRLKK